MSSTISSSSKLSATDTLPSEHIPTRTHLDLPNTKNPSDDCFLHSTPERADFGPHAPFAKYIEYRPGAKPSTADVALTPRDESRREGFNWGLQPVVSEGPPTSRNPLGPDQPRAGTPPPLAEIIRRMTNDDSYNSHRPVHPHVDSIDLHQKCTSTSTCESLQPTDARRPSIAAFAKGIARHVPDFRNFAPPEKCSNGSEVQSRRESQDIPFSSDDGKSRKTSIALSSVLKSRKRSETALNPSALLDFPNEPSTTTPATQTSATGSLRDRRKVKLDLSLPIEIPDLPLRHRALPSTLSSITPSRPRSPKTPWIRNEPPGLEIEKLAKSSPIIEEDYNQRNDFAETNIPHPILLPGTDAILSSQSPNNGYQAQNSRDRPRISRPRYNRSRSGRSGASGASGTSDSTFDHTPDGQESLVETQMKEKRQEEAAKQLKELGMTMKASRSRRWHRGASSDEPLQSPDPGSSPSSLNLFKRSNRLSDESGIKTKKQSPFSSRFWSRRQSSNTRSDTIPALIDIPVPPQFVPPGVQRVPTPPIYDANGEVKGKLADFFFEVRSSSASRKRPKPSPGGVWDSDALLMSLSSDLDPSDEEEEEGPEGPIFSPSPVTFEVTSTPGLVTGPDGDYLGVGLRSRGVSRNTDLAFDQESWFRIPHSINTPDEREFELQEEEERRKFEWLVPEHLPTSPLCPLHPKYRGPCKGLCLWHSSSKSKRKVLSRRETWEAMGE